MKKELKNTDKIMVSSRIPVYVKQYAEDKKLSICDLIMRGFDDFRSTDMTHALTRLEYHEDRVLHWKGVVLQNEQTCNTKQEICNTVREQFRHAGRGHPDNKKMDMNWIQAKVKHMVDQGIIVTPWELYDYCVKDRVGGGK